MLPEDVRRRSAMKKIVILGTGGNCFDIVDLIEDLNASSGSKLYEMAGFLDDDPNRNAITYRQYKVLGTLADARRIQDSFFVNGIGSPSSFRMKPAILAKTGLEMDRFQTLVHPTVAL